MTTGSLGTNTVPCEIDPAITWSHKDTTETARQIVGHNAVVKKLCPGVHGHLTIGGRRVQNYDVNFDLYSAIGEIRSDVKTLLKNGEGYDRRISWIEKKLWLAAGSAGALGMFVPMVVAKAFGWH